MLFACHLYRRWITYSESLLRLKEENLDELYWMGKLRYYAHAVDKGLQRSDFSQGHGLRAYSLTRAALSHISSHDGLADPSVQWAVQKLRQYEKCQSGESFGLGSEYVRTRCRYQDLLDAIKTRRSIRRYVDRPVADEVIEKITDVLDWSPTSCHRQPARVYATNNPDIVTQCVGLHAGAACFTDIYAPLFLTFCADSRLYAMPTELVVPHVDVALGVQNCLLIAHALGISLTPLIWLHQGEWQEDELRRIFSIPQHFQVILGAVGGYPDGGVQVPARKTKQLFIKH
jgi:nitroreductase